MSESEPITETVKASEARQNFSTLLNEVFRGEKRVIVEKSGVPVAALISTRDLHRFERYEQHRRERFKVLEEFSAAYSDVPEEEIEREVAKAIQEVREERRRYLRQREELAEIIEGLRKSFNAIPPDEIEHQLARVIAEAGAEYDTTDREQSSAS